eukprot:TRINITY_DN8563_c0_g2_i2.p2 TRINITY_DN8563_c0_g2~~TRINITY_DN8563_c0_g2_i2.p2  ORF type:complete len:170 (-),score=24.07 TRINITY_DN8563_c0_g2_i2:139-648(-)
MCIRDRYMGDHFFHLGCMKLMIGDKKCVKCPICSFIYGVLEGDQPQGTMDVYVDQGIHCDSYDDCATIVISYSFPHGKKNGVQYKGTRRVAYLPDNEEGREVCDLLKTAFERKLIFTVGTSVTTGQSNVVVWNGIHHKTNISGGPAYFGYPDETYFNRVKQELAAKGIY